MEAGVIVEPRNHSSLKIVIDNVCNNTNLPIILFHGTSNEELSKKIKEESNCDIHLKNLRKDNISVKEYNKLLYSKDFWNDASYFGDKILLFQTDSGICENTERDLQDFSEYDYCGAPWWGKIVGNGGFSIRSASKMIDMLPEKIPRRNEDEYFSKKCRESIDCNLCEKDVAKGFSMETTYKYPPEDIFGFHKPWGWGGMKHLENCPFAKTVKENQKLI